MSYRPRVSYFYDSEIGNYHYGAAHRECCASDRKGRTTRLAPSPPRPHKTSLHL